MTCEVFSGFFLGMIATAFGAWLAHIFSDRRRRKEEFNKAAAAFRATFVDEIFHLSRNVEPFFERLGERREDIEIANEKAKILFEVFLPQKELAGFNAAWEQYKNPKEKNNIKESPLGKEYYEELIKIRISHINHLLKYAKPKL